MPNSIDTAMPLMPRPTTASGDTCIRRRMLILSGSSNAGADVAESNTGTTAIETRTEARRNSTMLSSPPAPIISWPMPSPPIEIIM